MEEQKHHPLDDEELVVRLTLIHQPSEISSEEIVVSEPGMSVEEAIRIATERAKDDLLSRLEVAAV